MTKSSSNSLREYLSKSFVFINKNKVIYFIYLGLMLLEFFVNSVNFKALHIPNFGILLLLIILFFISIYNYSLQYYIFKKIKNEKIDTRQVFKITLQYAKRFFWPYLVCWLLFFVFIILLTTIVITVLHVKLTKNIFIETRYNHGLGFYPARATFIAILELLSLPFIFSPILFALKGQSFWRSLGNSFKIYLKNKSFVSTVGLIMVILTGLTSLFVPIGNYFLNLVKSIIDSYIFLLLGTATFFYFQDHYSIDNVFLPSVKQRGINVNIVYRRIIAAGVDILLWIIIFLIGAAVIGKTKNSDLSNNYFLIFFLLQFTYFTLLEWLVSGTIGKKIMRIRVTTEKGEKITFLQSFIRNLLRIIDIIPVAIPYLLGLVVLSANAKKQRLGDKLAHTIVSK